MTAAFAARNHRDERAGDDARHRRLAFPLNRGSHGAAAGFMGRPVVSNFVWRVLLPALELDPPVATVRRRSPD